MSVDDVIKYWHAFKWGCLERNVLFDTFQSEMKEVVSTRWLLNWITIWLFAIKTGIAHDAFCQSQK